MILAHKIALAPTPTQRQQFAQTAGCAQFTWNWALAEWGQQYQAGGKPTAAKLKKQFNAIKRAEYPWIYESPKDANQQVFSQIGAAFKHFFEKRAGYPKFKKKGKSKDAFYVSNDKFELRGKKIRSHSAYSTELCHPIRRKAATHGGCRLPPSERSDAGLDRLALIGFQGRGFDDVVKPDFATLLLIEVLIFQGH